jgi:hypothetical protein
MKIIPHGKGLFEFNLDTINDQKFIVQSKNFEAAKKEFLGFVENNIDRELENMFVKFNKEYNIDLNKNDLMK